MLGVSQAAMEAGKDNEMNKGKSNGNGKAKGRKLQGDTYHNIFEQGVMTPVKNQGSCGSCWAFTATSVLEGTIAVASNSAPVRLSEQQLVDCVDGNDCGGGWMSNGWSYVAYNGGSILYPSYPYTM